MRIFKAELREAPRDPNLLPGDELFEHVEYDDGSNEAFLNRLWHDLYGDEPPFPVPDAPLDRVPLRPDLTQVTDSEATAS